MAFDFSGSPGAVSGEGIEAWRAERRKLIESLARKQGLPLGRQVRIDFWNGPSLEGLLVLDEEKLFVDPRRDPSLHLRIGAADFHANEIAACTTLDWENGPRPANGMDQRE
ncbi:MAG: hypothetical protein WC076_13160 [Terrimicrobiaceae bacterium]